MLYKLYPLSTEPRRCVVASEEPPPVPKHTTASLAVAVRQSFPEMTVYEPKGKPFIVVQADLPLPRKDGRRYAGGRRQTFGKETHERRSQMGHCAIEAICRIENCRSEPVARQRALTPEDQARFLVRHGLSEMARELRKKHTL